MSVAQVEASIRDEAFRDAGRRVLSLVDAVEQAEITVGCRSAELSREIAYLERIAAAAPVMLQKELNTKLANLRDRIGKLQAPPSVGQLLGDLDDEDDQYEIQKTRQFSAISIASIPAQQRSMVDSGTGPDFRTRHQSATYAVASFLHPDLTEEDRNDRIRLMSAEGSLANELGKYPTYKSKQADTCMMVRMKSWSTADNAFVLRTWNDMDEDTDHEQLQILELSKQAAALREVAVEVDREVQRGQEGLDRIQAHALVAKQEMEAAVEEVAEAARIRVKHLNFLGPIIGVLVLLGGLLTLMFTGAGSLPLVLLGSVAGGLIAQIFARSAIAYQLRTLDNMTVAVRAGRNWSPFSTNDVGILRQNAELALDRFVELQRQPWNKVTSCKGCMFRLPVESTTSEARERKGRAFRATFYASAPAKLCLRVLERLRVDGNLEPGCRAMWSRPVDNDGTTVAYVVFSFLLRHREFFTVCKSKKLEKGQRGDRYAYAAMSLPEELFRLLDGHGDADGHVARGYMHVCGVLMEDMGRGRCRVEVVADVDPKLTLGSTDNKVRAHVIATAKRLRRAIAKAPKVFFEEPEDNGSPRQPASLRKAGTPPVSPRKTPPLSPRTSLAPPEKSVVMPLEMEGGGGREGSERRRSVKTSPRGPRASVAR